MKKKLSVCLLGLICLASLSACGEDKEPEKTKEELKQEEVKKQEEAEEKKQKEKKDLNKLDLDRDLSPNADEKEKETLIKINKAVGSLGRTYSEYDVTVEIDQETADIIKKHDDRGEGTEAYLKIKPQIMEAINILNQERGDSVNLYFVVEGTSKIVISAREGEIKSILDSYGNSHKPDMKCMAK